MLNIFPSVTNDNSKSLKIAAINKDDTEDFSRSTPARDTIILRNQEDYITQVSEEIESIVTIKLSKGFRRTKRRLSDVPRKLDEYLLNPQACVYSGPVPETSPISNGEKEKANKDRSQNDLYTHVGVFLSQFSQKFSPDRPFYSSVGYV